MDLLLISFIAGVLTVLAPCVFTLLPVILSGAVAGSSIKKPVTIIASLSVSIFIFTLVLKASTALIGIPSLVWEIISGVILIGFGIITLFPSLWDLLSARLGLSAKSDELLQTSTKQTGFLGDIALGAALGPVFTSCSPTFTVIIATVLPTDFAVGIINLIVYIIGLALVLFLIALFGQSIVQNLKWAVNPRGWFKRLLGVIFIILGLAIMTGFNKQLETAILDSGYVTVVDFESNLIQNVMN